MIGPAWKAGLHFFRCWRLYASVVEALPFSPHNRCFRLAGGVGDHLERKSGVSGFPTIC